MSAVVENHDHHDDHHHGPKKGILRWLTTTNHKDIGTLYLWFSFAAFLLGGAFAMGIRPNYLSLVFSLWTQLDTTSLSLCTAS